MASLHGTHTKEPAAVQHLLQLADWPAISVSCNVHKSLHSSAAQPKTVSDVLTCKEAFSHVCCILQVVASLYNSACSKEADRQQQRQQLCNLVSAACKLLCTPYSQQQAYGGGNMDDEYSACMLAMLHALIQGPARPAQSASDQPAADQQKQRDACSQPANTTTTTKQQPSGSSAVGHLSPSVLEDWYDSQCFGVLARVITSYDRPWLLIRAVATACQDASSSNDVKHIMPVLQEVYLWHTPGEHDAKVSYHS